MTRYTRHAAACVILATFASASAIAQDDPKNQKQTGQQQGAATDITLDQIEDRAEQLAGRTVTVTGKVSDILGPRLFTVDDGKLIDFDGDTVVVTPAPLAALVTEDATVTITGVVHPLVQTEFEQEMGWFRDDPTLTAEMRQRAGIVAQTVTMTRDGTMTSLTFDMTNPTQGGTGRQPVTDVARLAGANDAGMVGNRVTLADAKVESVAKDGGFWVSSGNERLFVMPDSPNAAKVNVGQTLRLEGVVLAFPDAMKARLGNMADDEEIYVYARQVTPAA